MTHQWVDERCVKCGQKDWMAGGCIDDPVKECEHCDGTGEIETENNGPIVSCPVCQTE